MNLLNLRRRVRRKTGINDTSVLANSAIDQDLNEGYRILSSRLANTNEDFFEEQKDKFSLVALSSLYSLPSDTIKVKQIRLAYTTPTSEGDYRVATSYDPSSVSDVNIDEINATTTNPIVDITNNYFRIFPKPTAASSNGGEIYYIAMPSALVNTGDSPVIPTQYHDLLTSYAAFGVAAEHTMNDRYTLYKKEWEEGLANMLRDVQPRNLNTTERMRNPFENSRKGSVTELW